MANDLLGDGRFKVTFCLNIANISAPLASELNAGTDLQQYMTKDGLGIQPSQSPVDNTSLASTSETERAGTTKYEIQLTCKHKELSADDVAYNTLTPGQMGYLAVRRTLPEATAWAADQPAEVYPVECGEPMDQPTAMNEVQKFISKLFNHTAPDRRAVVA